MVPTVPIHPMVAAIIPVFLDVSHTRPSIGLTHQMVSL